MNAAASSPRASTVFGSWPLDSATPASSSKITGRFAASPSVLADKAGRGVSARRDRPPVRAADPETLGQPAGPALEGAAALATSLDDVAVTVCRTRPDPPTRGWRESCSAHCGRSLRTFDQLRRP